MELRGIEEIKYIPLRHRKGFFYYFNDEGIIEACSDSDINERVLNYYKKEYIKLGVVYKKDNTIKEYINHQILIHDIYSRSDVIVFGSKNESVSNRLRKAFANIKVGDTYECVKAYLDESIAYYDNLYKVMAEKGGVYHNRSQGLDRFIIKILKPIILRVPENNNPKTFDIIKVQMDINSQWESDRTQYIIENKNEIINRAIDKIANDRSFKKYGVVTNILALTKIIKLNENMIELIFELKEKIRGKDI